VVIAYGGLYGDCGSYHGWVVTAPEAGGPLNGYEVDSGPGDLGGGIWGSGAAPVVDSSGDIWVTTGTGFSGSAYDGQESVVRLDANLNVLDHWAPANRQNLDAADIHLDGSQPLLLPGGLVFQLGTDGRLAQQLIGKPLIDQRPPGRPVTGRAGGHLRSVIHHVSFREPHLLRSSTVRPRHLHSR
jgi:hypothetical protein